jgi:PhnB protein
MIEELGHHLRIGNNTTIALELDSRAECDRLYAALAEGGGEGSGMMEQFWGYWGSVQDRFGIRWMFNHMN